MGEKLTLVSGSQQAWLNRQIGPAFEAVKQRGVIERELFLGRIDDLPHADIVFLMPQAFQTEQQRIRIREEVAQQDDNATMRDSFDDIGEQRRGHLRFQI